MKIKMDYDKINRLKQMNTSCLDYQSLDNIWGSVSNDYATSYTYDFNGNIRLDETANWLHNIQYYYGNNNRLGGITTKGIKDADFNKLLQENLRTGDFNIFDNKKIDIDPFNERASLPTSHNMMNKDNADTPIGKLAKEAAIQHTQDILKQIK